MIESSLQRIARRMSASLNKDIVIQQLTQQLREQLQVDRVVLYYFYRQWEGQVTFESISDPAFSILGSKGPSECFNQEYAQLYEEGRVQAIADIATENITQCHREFLQKLQVQANLVVPILSPYGLWGLLIAHHCHSPKQWSQTQIDLLTKAAQDLAALPIIQQRVLN
jgi:GAF domain-containing protein